MKYTISIFSNDELISQIGLSKYEDIEKQLTMLGCRIPKDLEAMLKATNQVYIDKSDKDEDVYVNADINADN